jgi:hypothetical protein
VLSCWTCCQVRLNSNVACPQARSQSVLSRHSGTTILLVCTGNRLHRLGPGIAKRDKLAALHAKQIKLSTASATGFCHTGSHALLTSSLRLNSLRAAAARAFSSASLGMRSARRRVSRILAWGSGGAPASRRLLSKIGQSKPAAGGGKTQPNVMGRAGGSDHEHCIWVPMARQALGASWDLTGLGFVGTWQARQAGLIYTELPGQA